MKNLRRIALLVCIAVAFISCSSNSTSGSSSDIDSIQSITLDSADTIVQKGSSFTLSATYQKAGSDTIKWSSTNEDIAVVSDNGDGTAVVTGKTSGNAKIKATSSINTYVSATCDVTVAVQGSVTFINDGSIVKTVSALVGSTIDSIPSASTKSGYSFAGWYNAESGGTKISLPYTVTANGDVFYAQWVSSSQSFNVSFYSDGTTISSQSYNGGDTVSEPANPEKENYTFSGWYTDSSYSGTQASFPYTVTSDVSFYAKWTLTNQTVSVTGVSLDSTSLSLSVDSSKTLVATVAPADATNKTVSWTTSDAGIATVSGGTVTAVSKGDATITVTTSDGGKKAQCSVTVTSADVSVTGVSLSKTSLSLAAGSSETLSATVAPANATNTAVTWASSNTAVATVNSGKVTAIAAGDAQITVTTTDGAKSATCGVTVTAVSVPVTGVTLSSTTKSLTVGDTLTLTATVAPSDATTKTVSWKSSNTSAATVSSSGVVTAVAAGSATITVTTTDGNKTASCDVTVAAAAFDGIRVVAAQSLGYNYIHYWTCSNTTTYPNTTWPGVAMSSGTGASVNGEVVDSTDYYYDFTGCTGVSCLVTTSSGGKLCSTDIVLSAKGIYRVTSSGATLISKTVPEVTISPSSGTVSTTGTITVTVSGNPTFTSGTVTVNSKTTTLSSASTTLNVSDYASAAGTTLAISATATNTVGTGTASASLTTTEAPTLTGNFNEIRMYQVMVSSFQDGDSSRGFTCAYGPSGQLTGGDLQGIINAIPYIKSLGMNAIWMTPIFNSNGDSQMDSTGYYTYDYFNVDPHFGTNDTFKTLVQTAHDAGLYVILDGVFGHWGSSVAASPNGKTPTRSNGQYEGCDYPASLEFFEEVAQYWITNYYIDGWRLDQCYQAGVSGTGVHTGGHNYWYEIRKAVETAAAANKAAGKTWGTLGYMVGEDWDGQASVIQAASVAPGSASGYGLRSCFDFPSRYSILNSLAKAESDAGGNSFGSAMSYVYETASDKGYYHTDGYYPNLFVTNHDLVRFGNLLNWKYSISPSSGDSYYGRHRLAIAALGAYTGPITVYYGDEWGAYVDGYTGNGSLGAYNDNAARTTGKISGFDTNQQALHDYAAKVMAARAANEALWNGTCTPLSSESSFYAVKKTSGSNIVVVLMNSGSSSVTYSVGSAGTDLINGGTTSSSVTVPAYTAMFIKL